MGPKILQLSKINLIFVPVLSRKKKKCFDIWVIFEIKKYFFKILFMKSWAIEIFPPIPVIVQSISNNFFMGKQTLDIH